MMTSRTHRLPDSRQLRHFGLIFASLILVLFVLVPWLINRSLPQWPFWISTPVAALALLWPTGLLALYRAWMKFGHVMGRINTVLILSALFFLLVTPIGWIMRLVGYDPMRRSLDNRSASYRVPSENHGREHMEKPF